MWRRPERRKAVVWSLNFTTIARMISMIRELQCIRVAGDPRSARQLPPYAFWAVIWASGNSIHRVRLRPYVIVMSRKQFSNSRCWWSAEYWQMLVQKRTSLCPSDPALTRQKKMNCIEVGNSELYLTNDFACMQKVELGAWHLPWPSRLNSTNRCKVYSLTRGISLQHESFRIYFYYPFNQRTEWVWKSLVSFDTLPSWILKQTVHLLNHGQKNNKFHTLYSRTAYLIPYRSSNPQYSS